MRSGYLSSEFTLFEQQEGVAADNFWSDLEGLDPDNGDKIFGCMGGDFARGNEDNMPYRGLDSTYSNRYCSTSEVIVDVDDNPTGVNVTTSEELCDHYPQEDVDEIPKMADNVQAVLEFLAKDEDGFFFMYEQVSQTPFRNTTSQWNPCFSTGAIFFYHDRATLIGQLTPTTWTTC